MNIEYIIGGIMVAIAIAVAVRTVRARYRHEYVVAEGSVALIYHEGKLAGRWDAGRHVRWGRHYRVDLIDVRKTLLQVQGQDVLSADNVGVKVSLVLTTQIVDPVKNVQSVDNYVLHLYSAAQSAVRAVVAGVAMDSLLNQRVAISGQLLELLAPQAEEIGVKVHAVEVRDVMLPGDLRRAFSEVLKAKQEGQAALERARGESAALRNLANAARLIESQPGVATLRFLQTLSGNDAKQMVVMSDMSAFAPVFKGRSGSRSATETESEET